ncbi:MAG: hypothetical protein IID59_04545 [Proteobacteria bacterium]|nr:hypothetical protein [Pseudomonadota bacterium]
MSNEIPIRLRLPDFVIIGAQKSASTFLQECIREHPAVYMNREEDAFFEDPEGRPLAIMSSVTPDTLEQ